MGTKIAEINGVTYYTDRIVREDGPTISVRVGYVEYNLTYNVYARSWSESDELNFQMPAGVSLAVNGDGDISIGAEYKLGQVRLR